jgi:alpha-L-arabinofuranosidase
MFHLFHRYAPEMPITAIAQMVNSGPIVADDRGVYLTPTGLAFKLYTEKAGDELLRSEVDCPKLNHSSRLPVIDVSVTRRKNKLSLFATNRHFDSPVEVALDIKGMKTGPGIKHSEIHHDEPHKRNNFEDPEAIVIRQRIINVEKGKGAGKLRLALKPHSINCFEIEI